MATTVDLIREELAKLEDGEGRVTPEIVVEAASDVRHPLHDYFEWDDNEAARRFRIDQARHLITRVKVEYKSTPGTIVKACVYIRDPERPTMEQGYRRVSVLVKDKADATAAMAIELARAMSTLQRAQEIGTALGLGPQVAAILRALTDLQKALG